VGSKLKLARRASKFLFTSGVARHRARPDLLVTYHTYSFPFHEVLYNRSIEELESFAAEVEAISDSSSRVLG